MLTFRFYRTGLLFDGFESLVQQSWVDFLFNADPIRKFSYKLKAVKEVIKNWLLIHRNDHNTRLEEIEVDIHRLDVLAESSPLSVEDWQHKQSLRREHFNILLGQELYWKQRSRIQWLKEGDLNTSFFHKIVNYRRRKNTISSLLINNTWSECPTQICNTITNYFFSLFNKTSYK